MRSPETTGTVKPRRRCRACHLARKRESHRRTRPKRLDEMAAYRRGRDLDEMKRYNRDYYEQNAERLKQRARERYRERYRERRRRPGDSRFSSNPTGEADNKADNENLTHRVCRQRRGKSDVMFP